MSPVLIDLRPSEAPAKGKNGWLAHALELFLVLALFFAFAIALQIRSGAFSAEFGHREPDEPSHYLNGLLVRDYVAAGFPEYPMKYAERYYAHYPKIAFGIWPPLLHVIEGAWMLVFSGSRTSVLLFMALVTAALCLAAYILMRREFSRMPALAGAALVLCAPVVAYNSTLVMADNLVALFSLLALAQFIRYLESESTRDAILFGLLAALSLLTKNNAMALAIVPPLALVFMRRFDLLTRPNFWYPVPIVALISGGWVWYSLRLMRDVHYREWSVAAMASAMRVCSAHLVATFGAGLSILVLAGLIAKVAGPFRTRPLSPFWTALIAFLISIWAFHWLIPQVPDPRYMTTAVPALAIFVIAGVESILRWVPFRRCVQIARVIALLLVVGLVLGTRTLAMPRKPYRGFTEAAEYLLSRPDLHDAAFLVSSQSRGEGMLITEIAMREKRPGHFILRASKALSSSDWKGGRYRLTLGNPEEIMAYLDKVPMRILVIDRSPALFEDEQWPHHDLLIRTVSAFPDRWRLIGTYPRDAQDAAPHSRIEVFERVGGPRPGTLAFRVDLPYTLGRSIEN